MNSQMIKRLMLLMLCTSIVWAGLGGSLVPVAYADELAIPPVHDGWVHISTAEQLIYINENQALYLDQNIKLLANIDLSGHAYNWVPFGGNNYPAFSGTFDGRGHMISGIWIRSEHQDIGFFGVVTGTIQNLGLSVDIQGGSHTENNVYNTGGLAGRLVGGQVIRCYSIGQVVGSNSTASGAASATGGLIGSATNSSDISYSYSVASVTGGNISNMYAGGLVGSQGAGTISHAYALGPVSRPDSTSPIAYGYLGGFIAHLIYGSIDSSYAAGEITSTNIVNLIEGGFIGSVNTSEVLRSYFDLDTTGLAEGIGSGGLATTEVTGLTTPQMQQEASFEGWDFTHSWNIHPSVHGGRPYLKPVILTASLPQATVQTEYTFNLRAFDGAAEGISWQVDGLPQGLAFSATGVIEGIPTEHGVFDLTIIAMDRGGATHETMLTLTVTALASGITDFQLLPGSVLGSTVANGTPRQPEHTYAYRLSDTVESQPYIGDALPIDTIAYGLGSDIEGVHVGQYLSIYEIDSSNRIQAWNQLQLEAAHIQSGGRGGTVTGAVYGTGNLPLEGVSVAMSSMSVTTDVYGRFVLEDIVPGEYELLLTASGYRAEQSMVEVIAGEVTDVGQIELTALLPDVPTPPTPAPSYPVQTTPPTSTVQVQINGQLIQMKYTKETAEDGRSRLRIGLDEATINTAFNSAQDSRVVIHIEPEEAIIVLDLPLAAVHNVLLKSPEAEIQLTIPGASYSVPLKVWATSKTQGQGIASLEIAHLTHLEQQKIDHTLAGRDIVLLGTPLQFNIYSNSEKVISYGNIYPIRTLTLNTQVDPRQATAVWIDTDYQLHFVPTTFDRNGEVTTASFFAPHDSTYAVIQSSHTFADLVGHWAEDDIIMLANKHILQGVTPNLFAPNRTVTRAEFLTMLVRALGLSGVAGAGESQPFTDVYPEDWFVSVVKIAYQAGLVEGNTDSTLRPHEPLTREQMATMLIRAINFTGMEQPAVNPDAMTTYSDASDIAEWASLSVMHILTLEIMNGMTETTFAPQVLATRAQSAVVLERLLLHLGFIDKE